jgi:serine/threonine-protein kinase
MGTIWVAEHGVLGREVAVKFLSEELAGDPNAVARFEREASAVAELRNPHIVEVLEYGFTESGLPYMATELLEGEDLGERLVRDRRIDPAEFAAIFDQVCDALAAAHELGIVHRDIKPENVFMVKDDAAEPSVRLLDFGIAKHWQEPKLDVTSTGVVVGTPHYMSPEQFLSAKHVDFRADLWSLGILAYRAITGRLPFEASSFAALCIQIHRGVFPRASAYRADLPSNLDGWFTKALRGHPAARFASARQMAETFRDALRSPSSERLASDPGRVEPPKDLARRHVAMAKLGRVLPSLDSNEETIDLGSLFPSADAPLTLCEKDIVTGRFRSRTVVVALVALGSSIAAVGALYPIGHGAPGALASRPDRATADVEPVPDPPSLPLAASAAPSMAEPPPAVIVPGKSIVAPPSAKKVPAAALAPPKEPDRGF